jgi:tetratricopeptide (TPR) repeat protein
VVEGDLKLIATPRPELYDLKTDPGERTNLAESRPDDVARLRAKLDGLHANPPSAAAAESDADTLEALAALGYVTGASGGIDPFSLPDPKDFPGLVGGSQRIDRIVDRGDVEEALELVDELLEQKPDAFEIRGRKVRLLDKLGRHDLAREFVEETAKIFPDDPRIWTQLATSAMEAQQWGRAVEHAGRALALDPKSRSAREITVGAQLRLGQDQDAITAGEAWMSEDARNYGLAATLGRYWLYHQDYPKAERYLRIAISGPNPRRGARVELAALAVAANARDQAYELLKDEVRDYPRHLTAQRALSRMYAEDGQYLMQKDAAEAVAGLAPREPFAQLDYAQCMFNLGDYRSARRILDGAMAMAPDDPDLLLLHANLLAKEGKKDEGYAVFQRANGLNEARIAAKKASAPTDTSAAAKAGRPGVGGMASPPDAAGKPPAASSGAAANTVAAPTKVAPATPEKQP